MGKYWLMNCFFESLLIKVQVRSTNLWKRKVTNIPNTDEQPSSIKYLLYSRVYTAVGKPGKSWNLLFQFPDLESHGI